MTQAKDQLFINNIQSGKYSDRELVNLYNNAVRLERDNFIEPIKLKLRADFPKVANRLFGVKQIEVVAKLEDTFAKIKYDLFNNKARAGVKPGGGMISGDKYLDYYISYKNCANLVVSLGLVQNLVDSELKAIVRHYKTGDGAFHNDYTYNMDDYSLAVEKYEQLLEGILP